MDDLISRQSAQTELMMKCERYTLARESHGMGHVEWSSDLISVADAMDAIRDLPSAQLERKKGKWIYHIDDVFPAESTMECDQCHAEQPLTCDDEFCPHCGVRMEGKE